MGRSSKRWGIFVAGFVLVGCNGGSMMTDGGTDAPQDGGDSGDDGSVAIGVAPPEIPWLADGVPPIMLAPCPAGWHEVLGGAVTECDPYPAGGAEVCDAGEAHFPGEPGCRPIGDACPTGDYATALPSSGPVVYVKEDAAAGGDGSLMAPHAALSEVPWAALSGGTTVALGKGTYPGTLPLRAGVTVLGACTAETTVTGSSAPVRAVVSVTSAGVPAVVKNLTIHDAPQFGTAVDRGRSLGLDGVLIDAALGRGLSAAGVGTQVTLTDVVIRDTVGSATVAFVSGAGAQVELGAHLEATRLLMIGNRTHAVFASGEGSVVTLTDAVLRDTRYRGADRAGGRGIDVESGGQVEATRILVAGNLDVGVSVRNTGSRVTLTDAVVRETVSPLRDGRTGRGLSVEAEGEFSGTRLLVADNQSDGVFADGVGTRVALMGAVIRDTVPGGATDDWDGRGVAAQRGAHLEATGLLLSGNTALAAFAGGGGTTVTLTDAAIVGTTPGTLRGKFGRALSVQLGAHFEASRLFIADNHELGIFAEDEGTALNLSDVVIQDTRAQVSEGRFGWGMVGQYGARIDGVRLRVEGSVEAGIIAHSSGAIVLRDVSVRDVAASDCVAEGCEGSPFGFAIGALAAMLSVSNFEVVDAAACGVIVTPVAARPQDGSLDLQAGVVSRSAIGACVQERGYDLDRLTDNVFYRDNGMNLDTTMLPIPSAPDALAF